MGFGYPGVENLPEEEVPADGRDFFLPASCGLKRNGRQNLPILPAVIRNFSQDNLEHVI